MLSYVAKSLARNPRRALAAVIGIALAFALFADTAFFVDGSGRQMTRRAIAPVALDMQAGVDEPLASSLSLATSVSPRPPIAASQPATVTLVATNTGPATATDVVLDAPRPASLAYQLGSTQRDGVPVPDVVPPEEGSTPSSPLDTGLRLGNLAPGASTTVSYTGTTIGAVPSAADLVASSVHSAEDQAPALANGHKAVDLETLASTVRRLPGVGAAQPFALVNAPTRSAQVGDRVLDAPITLVGMDHAYEQTIPLVRFGGQFAPGTAFLSPAAMQALGASPGMTLRLTLPGQFGPALTVPISAVADLTAGDQLFASRKEGSLGDYVAAPYVVGLDVATFQRQVLPALRADAAAPVPVLKQPPVLEVHAQAAKRLLDGDPGAAFLATSRLRRSIEQTGSGELTVIDNLSAILQRARTDSALARILFIALGLPGALLAGYLSFYGGGLLAETERRERALLRARGFAPAALARSLACQAVAIAALGSALGAAVALAVARALFPSQFDPRGAGFAISLVMAVGVSLLTTMLAIYLPGRRSILGDVTEARQAIARTPRPAWLRAKLDVILLVVAGAVFAFFVATGGLRPNPKASQESIARSFHVLVAPWCLWLGATLLAARGVLAVTRRVSAETNALDFRRHLVTRTLLRSVARRPAMVTAGIITVSLTVAFGVSLAIFVDTFRVKQRADARFLVGSDVRVTPSLGEPIPDGFDHRIRRAGGRASSPVARVPDVVVGHESVLYAAIDPGSFGKVAPLDQGFFTDISPRDAMSTLARDPSAVLVDKETADTLNLHKGDTVKLQVPSVALGQPAVVTAHVAGTLIQFPGFPLGLDFVGTLDSYQQATGASTPSYLLVSTDGSRSSTSRVAASLRADLGTSTPTRIETTEVVGNQDQSSLAGLSLTGLGRVEGLYMLLIACLATVLFVAAVLMQRDTERTTMRALGLARSRLHALIFGEVLVVATTSVMIGTVIGIPMAYLFEQILRRVFVVPPTRLTLPSSAFVLVVVLLLFTLLVAAAIIAAAIRRLPLVELLRAE